MKQVLLLLLGLLFLSWSSLINDDVREFHVKVAGEHQVEKFEKKFPQITSNKSVYIAYLGKYYNGHEDAYARLLY